MDFTKREKYSGKGRTIVKTDKKIDINFDLNALNLMCSYILSENKNIRRSHLINIRNLFELIDLDVYINDAEKMKRVSFIRKGLEGRILQNLRDPAIVMKYVNGNLMDTDLIDVRSFTLLSNEELNWINETISGALKYAFLYNDIDRMIDVATRFKAADYRSRDAIVDEVEALITEMQTKFRRTKAQTATEMTFSLRNGNFEEIITDIHEQLSNPSRRLLCGMQGLNELTGGGFEAGRCYMLFGATGVGKSLVLMNIAEQLKKYNKNFKTKDPTKIPVVVMLTQENTVRESVERLFDMTVGGKPLAENTVDEAIRLLRTEGELYLSDESPIDIIIKYVPDKSIDTGYLYTMVEDLEDEGYEVIALIQDHVKRIRSIYKQPDIRLELGAVVNEFKIFAMIKDLPVISNSHLNRDGAKTIDEGSLNNKADLTRMLGRANVGESMLMLDNLDWASIINVEYDAQGNKFMIFSRMKMRQKASLRNYICHPFVNGNGAKLVEDFYMPVPVFKDTLKVGVQESDLYVSNNINKRATYNNIKDIDEVFNNVKDIEDGEINIFTASRYRQSATTTTNIESLVVPMPVVTEQVFKKTINPVTFLNEAV